MTISETPGIGRPASAVGDLGLGALLDQLAGRAAETEALGRIPDATIEALQERRLLQAIQPRARGGLEMDIRAFFEIVEQVAGACPSTGWVLSVLGVHPWQIALFPPEAHDDVWGDDDQTLVSSSYAPMGTVEVVDGGFRLSGHWQFSSGCDHCTWVLLGAVVPTESPVPDMRTFLVPRSDYRILDDTWDVIGLAGTGSKDVVVDDAFVPEHRTHRFVDAFMLQNPGQAVHTAPLYRLPFGCVFSHVIAYPAVGAAAAAVATYGRQTRARIAAYDGSKVSDDAFAQARLAAATSEVAAARRGLGAIWDEMIPLAEAHTDLPVDLRARARWAAADAVARSVTCVERVFEAAGGGAIRRSNPLQRSWRDIHAMRAHALNNPDKAAVIFGKAELQPDTPPDFFL